MALSAREWFTNEEELFKSIDISFFMWYWGGGVYGLSDIGEKDVQWQQSWGCGYWLESISDTTIDEISTELRVYRTFDLNELAEDIQLHIDSLPPFRTYYARGISLIRKEMYNGDVWELKEYFINN